MSGLAGWRCLNPFFVAYGTTEVVPFPKPGFTAVSFPTLFRKEREKRMGHPLGWYDVQDGNLRHDGHEIDAKEHEITRIVG